MPDRPNKIDLKGSRTREIRCNLLVNVSRLLIDMNLFSSLSNNVSVLLLPSKIDLLSPDSSRIMSSLVALLNNKFVRLTKRLKAFRGS